MLIVYISCSFVLPRRSALNHFLSVEYHFFMQAHTYVYSDPPAVLVVSTRSIYAFQLHANICLYIEFRSRIGRLSFVCKLYI